ncbi:ABC transporter permease [Streptomyces sp. ISL-10]|uniref:ABC transporter permease n=1 Tax=Streptomyces sp. ISL-10 TaxID=2819172 RepID=UPI001BE5BB82|nr:ABC transporter permease [Streptomyces sp. ISL-10]MBT2369336.1 ABC transporter permease [Streptomyces sp. ISL-10]
MTTTAATPQPSFLDLVSSEWIKIRTVSSTVWCLTLFTLITIGIAALVGLNRNADAATPNSSVAIDRVVTDGSIGVGAGQLAIVVLAASAIGGEYGSGMIRTSLTTVPWRRRWLAAKALVVALIALVAGAVVNVVAFAVGCVVARDVSGALTDPGIARAVLGGGLYLSALALLTLAVATVARGTAGAIITMSAMIYVMPFFLLGPGFDSVQRFLPAGLGPGNAGWAIMQPGPMLGGLAPWSGFAVLCAWVVSVMAGAVYAVEKRDI